MTEPRRLPRMSDDVLARRLDSLRVLIPEAFVDNQLDFHQLREALGSPDDSERERYGLSWAGRADAIRVLQTPTTATLVPRRAESLGFDNARHTFVEGDNLEVLKLLQRSYHSRIKMIYIDPPYNTGGEFIYPDDYRDSIRAYLRMTGQVDANGDKMSTHTETNGRYHSAWLSMMYPRLALARNLLRQDGVIFISADDHEIHNLRLLTDEVFGPENFIANVIWQKVYSPKSSARHFSEDHDYVLIYARNAEEWRPGLIPRTSEQDAAYTNPDNDPRGRWKPSDLSARNYYSKGTYSVTFPSGRFIAGPPRGRYWVIGEERFHELDEDNCIWWGPDGDAIPQQKRFLSEVLQGRVPQTLWYYKDVGHTQEAKRELLSRVQFASSDSVFDTPKPTRLIRRMLTLATSPNGGDIVLDFFAGSGSTGDAVMQANAADNGDRRFILVQVPEPTGYDDYPLVTNIARERLRNAATAIQGGIDEEHNRLSGAFGFRTYSLAASNFKIWDTAQAPTDGQALAEHLTLFEDSLGPGALPEDVLVEVIVKAGLPLDLSITTTNVAGSQIYLVGGSELAVCLAEEITTELTAALAGLEVSRIVVLDSAFAGRDELKTNTVLTMRDASIEFRTA